jgi:predicted AAA+ superfamily ATPase
MIDAYADAINLATQTDERSDLHHEALAWSITRGSRSGRVAWQFITHAAGEAGIAITI